MRKGTVTVGYKGFPPFFHNFSSLNISAFVDFINLSSANAFFLGKSKILQFSAGLIYIVQEGKI